MTNSTDLLLRWSIGGQDTVRLKDFSSEEHFKSMIWLTKMSIASFQKWFPDASFLLLYNGYDFNHFYELFFKTDPQLLKEVLIIDQRNPSEQKEKFINPYHFVPVRGGVWYKWVPFRFDSSKHEIAVDTDILCLNEPTTWYKWLENDDEILIAPERYETVIVNTCGDFFKHPLLKGRSPFNCGVVGQKKGCDFSERFFDITKEIEYGDTHNSLFITEQGAINLWVRSLEAEGISHTVLDFQKNAWIRDFVYFLEKGVQVETVHAVTWHKSIAKEIGDILEKQIFDANYDKTKFLQDVIEKSSCLNRISKHIIRRQVIEDADMETEFLKG